MASGDATFDASSACNGCNVWKRWDDNGDNPKKRDVVAVQSGDGFIVIKNDEFQMNEFCIKTPNLPVGTYCNLGTFLPISFVYFEHGLLHPEMLVKLIESGR